jgi:hypothetical protein
MELRKQAIPIEWQGDLTQPYESRYQRRFPNELEFLRTKAGN